MDCAAAGCSREATQTEGVAPLCKQHYMLWRRYGYVGSRYPRTCTVEGCNAKHVSGGLCSRHYKLMHEFGSTEDRPRKNARKPCTVEGCDGWRVGWGLCRLHYERARALDRPPVLYEGRVCGWCEGEIPATRPKDAIFCSTKCKQWSGNERQRQRPESFGERRDANLRIKFGISRAEYDAMLAAQDGRCAICRSDTPGGRGGFCVDHDHETGEVRGTRCNAGLGQFQDGPERMEAAAAYVRRHRVHR